ncbi:MAG TPA: hypothetical protein VGF82_03375, partial [Terracidiphilus sp.]
MAIDPPLPGHVDLAPDAALSGVGDPAQNIETRQRVIVAAVLLGSLLDKTLDTEFVLGVHHLSYTCEAQIVRETRGCDCQVHAVAFVGPLGAVVAGRETQRVSPRFPSVDLIHHCCWEVTDVKVVAIVREA